MSSLPTTLAAEAGTQEAAAISGVGSSAGIALPKLPSWGASGWQALFKQQSAGAANFADLLADPGGEGGSAQLGGEAGASPLFKWTSDGSMMEELMKAYKDSSPGTPTFGGGAQGNSLFRDGSLIRDGSLYKDGSITSCLQAAFQAQLEEEEQQVAQASQDGSLASVPGSPHQNTLLQTAAQQPPADAPFTFTAVGANTNDSPQLHVPELQLGPQPGQPSVQYLRQQIGQQAQPEPNSLPDQSLYHQQMPSLSGPMQQQQLPLQHQQELPQQQQLQEQQTQQLQQQLLASQSFSAAHSQAPAAAGQEQLQMPSYPCHAQFQYTTQAMQQAPQQVYAVQEQQLTSGQQQVQQSQRNVHASQYTNTNTSHIAGPNGAAAVIASAGFAPELRYPQLPEAAMLGMPQGHQPFSGSVRRSVITSGAMGPSVWSKSISRSVSPSLQAQGGATGSTQHVQNADGSLQAVPRIVIRTSTAMGQPTHAEPPKRSSPLQPQQQPQSVVLHSRVVPETGAAAPGGPHPPAHHTWTQHQPSYHTQQQQQQVQPSHGMHEYQQQHQPAAPYHQVRSSGFPAQQQARYQSHQLPQQQQQQVHQVPPQEQSVPRPGSFQELLSAPVLPERHNSSSVIRDPSTHSHQAPPFQQQQQQQQLPAAQPTAIYSGQVVHGPVASSHDAVTNTPLQYSYAPSTVPDVHHMAPLNVDAGQQQQGHSHQQHQHHHQQHYHQLQQQQHVRLPQHMIVGGLPSSSAQLPALHPPSSPVYPPMQFPGVAAGPTSAQPSSSVVPQPRQALYGHPYHGQASQAMDRPMYQHHQQQQQQQTHYYPHSQASVATPPSHSHAGLQFHASQSSSSSSGLFNPSTAQVQTSMGQNTAQALERRSHPGASANQAALAMPSGGYLSHATHFQSGSQQLAQSSQQASVQSQQQPAHAASFHPHNHHHHHTSQQQQQQHTAAGAHHGSHATLQQQPPASGTATIARDNQGANGPNWGAVPGSPAAGSGPMPGAAFPGVLQQPVQGMPGHGSASLNTLMTAAASADPSQASHGTVLLTSRPVASSEVATTGKVVSFAPELAQAPHTGMPSIPVAGPSDDGIAKENIQDQASQPGPPPQPGRKFKRDRSSRKNSFSLPPVPPKKQASAAVDFSPESTLEYVLQGAASAPIPLPQASSVQSFTAELAAASMRHSASCQDMVTDDSTGDLQGATGTTSGGKSSRSSSADVIFCADGIDFNSRAWKMMSRKEKNRASAAASRARREAYTESLEDKVLKLQAERDWLQEQIDPGSVEKPTQSDELMQVPTRPPVRHLSL